MLAGCDVYGSLRGLLAAVSSYLVHSYVFHVAWADLRANTTVRIAATANFLLP